jgi:hypothetical protein
MDCFLPVHAVLEVGQEPLVIVAYPGEALQQRVPLLRAELLHVDLPELALGHGQHGRPRAVVGRQLLQRRPPQSLLVVAVVARHGRREHVARRRPHRRALAPQAPGERVYLPGVVHGASVLRRSSSSCTSLCCYQLRGIDGSPGRSPACFMVSHETMTLVTDR